MRAREREDVAAVGAALGAWFRRGTWLALVSEATKTSGVPVARAVGALRRFPEEVNAAAGLRRVLRLDDAGGRWPPRLAVVVAERRAA